jgi:RHS repeat-associated protein
MTYDANGNLTNDGTNTYVWDRANRLLSVGSSSYAYDGMNNRVQQTVSGTATKYLLDIQPGLTQVIGATTGASTDRYIHSLRGIHAMKNNAGNWIWPTQDGLGNVRQEVSDALAVNGVRSYEPFLTPFDEQGSFGMPFAATGEMTDVTQQVYLRNRYLSTSLGQFVSLDPFEGVRNRPMSLNGYSWVEGNSPNSVDPSGREQNCSQGDCGAPMNIATSVNTPNGTISVPENEYFVIIGENPIEIIRSGTAGPKAPPGDIPVNNIARVVIYEPTFASIDVAYPSSISPSAIARYFNGEVVAVFDAGGQQAIWLAISGQPLPETGTLTALAQKAIPNMLLLPQTGTSVGIQPIVDPVLQAISQKQCLKTPDPSSKKCDPVKALAWMLGRGILENDQRVQFDYQRRYGGLKYQVPTGTGETIVADGARAADCALIDTKYVGSPENSPYVIGSSVRMLPFISDLHYSKGGKHSIDFDQNDEFRRYGLALRAPESVNPFVKMEVITNNFAAVPYFQFWINQNNVPNASFRYGPWP